MPRSVLRSPLAPGSLAHDDRYRFLMVMQGWREVEVEGETIRAETGDIVVALIDDEEATLKRLRRRGSSIALEAANPAYETRVLGPDRVQIQGRLVSLVRRY